MSTISPPRAPWTSIAKKTSLSSHVRWNGRSMVAALSKCGDCPMGFWASPVAGGENRKIAGGLLRCWSAHFSENRSANSGGSWVDSTRQSATNRRWPQDAFDDLSWVDGGYDPHLPLVSNPRAGSFSPGCAWSCVRWTRRECTPRSCAPSSGLSSSGK